MYREKSVGKQVCFLAGHCDRCIYFIGRLTRPRYKRRVVITGTLARTSCWQRSAGALISVECSSGHSLIRAGVPEVVRVLKQRPGGKRELRCKANRLTILGFVMHLNTCSIDIVVSGFVVSSWVAVSGLSFLKVVQKMRDALDILVRALNRLKERKRKQTTFWQEQN